MKSEVEGRIKKLRSQLKQKADELSAIKAVSERSKVSFLSVMRSRLRNADPIKYTQRHVLDKDIRYLAVACQRKIPPEHEDLEAMVQKAKSRSSYLFSKPEEIISPIEAAESCNVLEELMDCTKKKPMKHSPLLNVADPARESTGYSSTSSVTRKDSKKSPRNPRAKFRQSLKTLAAKLEMLPSEDDDDDASEPSLEMSNLIHSTPKKKESTNDKKPSLETQWIQEPSKFQEIQGTYHQCHMYNILVEAT